jgi:hypothetical protein
MDGLIRIYRTIRQEEVPPLVGDAIYHVLN